MNNMNEKLNLSDGHIERNATRQEQEERMWPTFGAGYARMWCRHQYLKLLILPTLMALLLYNQLKMSSFMAKQSDYLSKLVDLYGCVVSSELTSVPILTWAQCSSLNRSSEVFYVSYDNSLPSWQQWPQFSIRQFNCSKGVPDFYYDFDNIADFLSIENSVAAFAIKNTMPLLLTYLVLETLQLAYFDLLSIAPSFKEQIGIVVASPPTLEHLAGFRIGLCANDARGCGLHISYGFFLCGVCPTFLAVGIFSLNLFYSHCVIVSRNSSNEITLWVFVVFGICSGLLYPIRYYVTTLRPYLKKYKSFELVADHCRSHFISRRFSEQATIYNRCPLYALLLVFLFLLYVIIHYILLVIFVVLLCLKISSLIAYFCCFILDICFLFPLQLCSFNSFKTKLTQFREKFHKFMSTVLFPAEKCDKSFKRDQSFLLLPREVWIYIFKKCRNILFDNGCITSEVKSCILDSSE